MPGIQNFAWPPDALWCLAPGELTEGLQVLQALCEPHHSCHLSAQPQAACNHFLDDVVCVEASLRKPCKVCGNGAVGWHLTKLQNEAAQRLKRHEQRCLAHVLYGMPVHALKAPGSPGPAVTTPPVLSYLMGLPQHLPHNHEDRIGTATDGMKALMALPMQSETGSTLSSAANWASNEFSKGLSAS